MLITNSSFMKSRFLFLLFLFYSCYSTAQISNTDKKQISKIIGEDFIMLPNQKSYPYCDYSDSFKVDMSTSILNDTVGVSFHNEHLLWHDLISFCGKEEVLKLAKPSYVTVEEYLEFQNWVRDSIARDQIYLNETGRTSCHNCEWTDDNSRDWINYSDIYWDTTYKEFVEYDPSDRVLGRALFSLNWKRPLNYNDPKLIPLLADLYIPLTDRLYHEKEFDERKFMYRYNHTIQHPYSCPIDSLFDIFPFQKLKIYKTKVLKNEEIVVDEMTASLTDSYSWTQRSLYERDKFSVLSHVYEKLNLSFPAVGINNPQTRAFCNWKQKILQQELNKKNLPYTVLLTLPTMEDQLKFDSKNQEFIIATKDYTEQWKITNSEYLSFIQAVQDSVLRENLFNRLPHTKMGNNEANKLLRYTDLYFDENTLEYTEFNISDRLLNRYTLLNLYLFPLNYSFNLKSLSPEYYSLMDSIKKSEPYTHPQFRYEYIDSERKSELGEIVISPITWLNYFDEKVLYNNHLALFIHPEDSLNPKGKDLDLSHYNLLDQTSSVRSHENPSRFIVQNAVSILPHIKQLKVHPDSLIKTITYEQAIAFYYWKHPIHNPNPKDDWQKFVLPSKEQFEAVQSGKQVIVPEKKVPYPTPLFRYVVHVYPK